METPQTMDIPAPPAPYLPLPPVPRPQGEKKEQQMTDGERAQKWLKEWNMNEEEKAWAKKQTALLNQIWDLGYEKKLNAALFYDKQTEYKLEKSPANYLVCFSFSIVFVVS
jgi:hypothetical protein